MAASEWIATIEESKVPEGGCAAVYPKGLGVLLVKVDGALHAVANKCFHMGCPLEGGKVARSHPHVPVPRLAVRRA